MLGNLALADRRRTVLDKAENLVARGKSGLRLGLFHRASSRWFARSPGDAEAFAWADRPLSIAPDAARSEEHTSELQSLLRISYAVFCLKTKKTSLTHTR